MNFFFFLQDLSEKLLEIISIASVPIQREIITAIPEILDDNEHVEIARALMYVKVCLYDVGLQTPHSL